MNVFYTEIDPVVEAKIIVQYGSWVRDYGCLVKGDGCYSVAAVDGGSGVIAGFDYVDAGGYGEGGCVAARLVGYHFAVEGVEGYGQTFGAVDHYVVSYH